VGKKRYKFEDLTKNVVPSVSLWQWKCIVYVNWQDDVRKTVVYFDLGFVNFIFLFYMFMLYTHFRQGKSILIWKSDQICISLCVPSVNEGVLFMWTGKYDMRRTAVYF